MTAPNSIFEVTRNEYKTVVEEIKPEYRRIEEITLDNRHKAIKIFSKKSGKCLTSRVIDLIEDEKKREPEKYYLFNLPDNEERNPSVPYLQLTLETKEEVQAFFDALQKMKE